MSIIAYGKQFLLNYAKEHNDTNSWKLSEDSRLGDDWVLRWERYVQSHLEKADDS